MMTKQAPQPVDDVLLGDIALAKLDALAEALDLPEREAQRIARVFELLSSPWALWPSGETPPWPSDISDDGSPFEFSAAFDGGEPKLRLLVESQGLEQTPTSTFEAGLALNERLRNAGLVDLTAFNRIVDLFTPSRAPSRFQLWHAAELGVDDCLYKAYLNPQVLGPSVAHELLREALIRLDMPHAWERLAPHLNTAAQRAELRYISVDLKPLGEARVKVYLGRSTASEVEELLAGLWPADQARNWLSELSGFEGPYTARPVLTCFSFRPGEAQPEATLHVPVRCYVPNDAEAAARAGRYLRPSDSERLTRALRAVAGRPLRAGRGLLTYVSLRAAKAGLRVTTYIAPEVYSIQAQRPALNQEHSSEHRIRIPRTETTTFGDALALIARRGELFGEHPFLVHLEGNGTLDEVRLFAPRLGFFVMCFQDVLRLAHKSSTTPELRALAATHLVEDRGHDRWFLADLERLGVPLNVEGLFHTGHESTRDVGYSLVSLVLSARDDCERFAVAMSLEAMAGQFFGRMIGFLERMGEDQLEYFGRRHQTAEASHEVFEDEAHARVAAIEIHRLAVPDVVAAIDKTFGVLTELADELWDALQVRRASAPPGAA